LGLRIETKLVLCSIVIIGLLGFTQVPIASALTVTITDPASCVVAGGVHQIATNECHFAGSLTIPQADTWNVSNLRFSVATLILEGQVTTLAGLDVDQFTNRGTLNLGVELISIGPNNSWLNDCGGVLNLLSNAFISFNGAGTNHGTLNGDATNDINPANLQSNTLFNSGFVDPSIVLTNVVIQQISSPCPTVGGELIPVDNVSLVLAYGLVNSWWMAPIGIGIGVGIYLVKRKIE